MPSPDTPSAPSAAPPKGADWHLAVVMLLLIATGAGIAWSLGNKNHAALVILPLIMTVTVGQSAGLRSDATAGATALLLVLLAVLLAPYPILAGLGLAALLLWTASPSPSQPPKQIATPLLLCYLVPVAFGPAAVGLRTALPFALSGLVGGLAITAILSRVTPHSGPTNTKLSKPTEYTIVAILLAAAISASLLSWKLSHHSIAAAWVLMTFLVVLEPSYPNTLDRCLRRVGGTLIGAAVVTGLTLLPSRIEHLVGMAAIVPAIAYNKVRYIVSVAATTVMVVTIYGRPDDNFIVWALDRTRDTGIGVALAIAFSAFSSRESRLVQR